MYHYRVDFTPVVDETKVRLKLMRQFRGTDGFGNFIFDGHSLWKTSPLAENLLTQVAKLEGDTTEHRITIKLVSGVAPGDPQYLQLYNNVTRACLRILKLCSMGRNYFDPNAEVVLPQYRLKLWPGFVTTVSQHLHYAYFAYYPTRHAY